MPTFDGGHGFLTALLPIKTRVMIEVDGVTKSPAQMVRDALAELPTAHQSPATEAQADSVNPYPESPFAKDLRTHFARMAVIDDVIFEGRLAENTFLSDPLVAQPVDELPCPYLMLIVDFDAPNGSKNDLTEYLRDIWTSMHSELEPVFTHCFGYANVTDAAQFAEYVASCQVETTMSFNDYYLPGAPALPTVKWQAIVVGIGVFAVVLLALHELVGVSWLWSPLFAVTLTVCALYATFMYAGARSFPAAANSDLRSILKALYLQDRLVDFAVSAQGKNDADLYKLFGAFLAAEDVCNVASPTQKPGRTFQ